MENFIFCAVISLTFNLIFILKLLIYAVKLLPKN